jgi:WD40 repeat protein
LTARFEVRFGGREAWMNLGPILLIWVRQVLPIKTLISLKYAKDWSNAMRKKEIAFTLIFAMLLLFGYGCWGNDADASTVTHLPTTEPPKATAAIISVNNFSETDNSDKPSEKLLIVIAGMDYGSLFLVDVETGIHQNLEIPGETGINIYGWADDGCTLIVGTATNQIIRIDVNGEIKDEIIRIDDLEFDGEIILPNLSLSPNGRWLAFLSGTGHREYATYEFQNLISISIQDKKYEVFPLTHSGLVNNFSWNPNDNSLAYNDVDKNGIQQVFLSDANGSGRVQLTDFFQEELIITSLQWSPTGEKIAMSVFEENVGASYLIIIDMSSGKKIIPIRVMTQVNEYWWAPNDTIVAKVLENPNQNPNKTLSWYSSTTGEKIGEFDSTVLTDEFFILPGPLTFSTSVGFFSNYDFYIYDISSSHTEQLFNQFTDIRYWISSPSKYDVEKCNVEE